MKKKIKFVFEGQGTPGDGTYKDTTLPEYFPDGDMCVACKNINENCSAKDFKSMKPIINYYLDGTKAVRCVDFVRS